MSGSVRACTEYGYSFSEETRRAGLTDSGRHLEVFVINPFLSRYVCEMLRDLILQPVRAVQLSLGGDWLPQAQLIAPHLQSYGQISMQGYCRVV